MSPQARKTLHFAKFLESQNCILRGNTQVTLKQIAPIVFWPERLTTQKARLEMLKESTRTASRDIDAFAAAEILRDFLAALENPAAVEDEIYGGGAGIGRVISSSQRFNTTKQALHGEFTQVKDYRERQEMYSRKLKSRAIAKEKNDRKNNR